MHLSDADFAQKLQDCNWRNGKAVADLVSASYTNVKFNEVILEKQQDCLDSVASYFEGFFGTRVWEDGQGMDEVREYATPPYIPISYEYFVEKMKPCKDGNRDDCDWEACIVPEGGRGTLPPFQMFEWGIETPRQCIANIRHIRDFRYWGSKVIENRMRYDDQLISMFYTMAAWKTAGHKVVLEYQKSTDANGVDTYTPWPSSDPRNPFHGFRYNYMEEFFPAVGFPENIGPLSIDVLETLGRHWSHNCNDYWVAKGQRGEKIWEFWFNTDWYREEGIQDPDQMEKLRYTMPSKLFAGYSTDAPREVIGNFAVKIMPWLPRLQESSSGGLIPVDTHTGVDIEVGQDHFLSQAWLNAPFSMALIPSPQQGSIITRPDLTTSPEGFPILPITGQDGWRIRNDYDKECNKHLNKPYSEKHYEMGMQMDDPDAAIAIVHRNRLFRVNPENFCDLQPVNPIAETAVCNDFFGVGCHQSGRKPHQASITEVDFSTAVSCTSQSCGSIGDPPFMYELQVNRKANNVDFNPLDCACGTNVQLLISDEGDSDPAGHGGVIRTQQGTIVETSYGFPYGNIWVTTATELAAGECITGIMCEDGDPTVGQVINCDTVTVGTVIDVVTDSVMVQGDGTALTDGDTVNLEFLDADGAVIGAAVPCDVSNADPAKHEYTLTANPPVANFSCDGSDVHANPSSIRITAT